MTFYIVFALKRNVLGRLYAQKLYSQYLFVFYVFELSLSVVLIFGIVFLFTK